MKEQGIIEHQGIITGITRDKLSVNLLNISNCSGCHAKSMCNVSDVDNKTIEIDRQPEMALHIGDPVILKADKSAGPRALLLGYLLPFILVTVTLVVAFNLTGDEPFSGLLSLFMLFPYYLTIYLIRDRLKDKFSFGIKSQIKV